MLRFLILLLYNILYAPALLFMAPGALRKMKARGGRVADLRQRFGRFDEKTKTALAALRARGPVWWMHAVSVGEVGVAARLVMELASKRSDLGIVLSTTTPTGYAEAGRLAAKLPGRVIAIYNPLDLWFTVRRCLDLIAPERLVLVEAEVWPNLVFAASRRSIPVSLINARLSPRSERRYGRFLPWVRPIFSMLSNAAVPEPEDVDRWQTLGVERPRIAVTGNIKYDTAGLVEPVDQVAQLGDLLRRAGWPADAPVLLAASTHAGEEAGIARVYLELKGTFPELRLIIVPRHAERAEGLLRELNDAGVKCMRRSTPDAASGDALLVDTTGELRAWQHLATVVAVGKSFPVRHQTVTNPASGPRNYGRTRGGQNPAEAIMAERPVVFGPHMENFEILVRQLLAAGGALQVKSFGALGACLRELLSDPPLRARLAAAGQEALLRHKGATARTAELLR